MTMKALTQAARAICLVTAKETDVARRAKDAGASARPRRNRVALLTPIAKAFSTDIGCEVASIGVQVHGGMGFIEETGAAQIYRDARILPIYEGTNGIQAIDLVTRKLPLEGGKVVAGLHRRAAARRSSEVRASNRPEFGRMGERLGEAVAALAEATAGWAAPCRRTRTRRWPAPRRICACSASPPAASTSPRGALAAARNGGQAHADRHRYARFFAENIAVTAPGLAAAITSGADAILDVEPRALAG